MAKRSKVTMPKRRGEPPARIPRGISEYTGADLIHTKCTQCGRSQITVNYAPADGQSNLCWKCLNRRPRVKRKVVRHTRAQIDAILEYGQAMRANAGSGD